MRRFISIVLFIVLCLPQCTLLRPSKPQVIKQPVIIPIIAPQKQPVATVNPIDTNRPITKTIYVNQIVPDRNYYFHMDSLINSRMSLFADSNKSFIGSQALVLADYKYVLLSNVKLIDSLKKIKQEKRELRIKNIEKDNTIKQSNNLDYYIATGAWGFTVILLILALIKQYRLKHEILAELGLK